MPASAVAWFALASPNEATTIASLGRSVATPIRRERARLNAVPVAFGRWLAIVDVCGGTQSARLPQTLWRPPEIGSSDDATMPSSASNAGVEPGSLPAQGIIRPPDR